MIGEEVGGEVMALRGRGSQYIHLLTKRMNYLQRRGDHLMYLASQTPNTQYSKDPRSRSSQEAAIVHRLTHGQHGLARSADSD